ncbi:MULTISPECIES: D-sedoheptulose-7-phosphate isomerase [Thermomonosporaceae]|uniref:D-sedoheptulose-7-phosphate isomerase n=1 Tax=Thermomonosporaceae TaxID=2012 RepID=UPI00255A997D|nr:MULTISPECIES: SIS domain-containing protein [Thermomonosporaceae]MDL4774312.1 SIS domain-containing protein [Actinomadura xylanilytica]
MPPTPDVREIFARRAAPAAGLAEASEPIARACRAMAVRFRRGGRLFTFGNGGAATDAQHIAVEFVHPVIVGKRALPALSLTGDVATVTGVGATTGFDEVFAHQLRYFADAGDIALGVSPGGRCPNVLRGLREARALGLLTIALTGGGGDGSGGEVAAAADHAVVVASSDPRVVKEVHVTSYHVLWELTHVFLERGDL